MYTKIEIEKYCNIAIKNILKEGVTDVELFKRPFELDMLKSNDILKEVLKNCVDAIYKNNFKELKIKKIGHVLVPKKNIADYRNCAMVDIIDEIKYLTLVLLISDKIERERNRKDRKRVFSYRVKLNRNNDYIFDTNYNYNSFKKRVLEKSKLKTVKVIVSCDIANYYDRLNIHRLESILLSMKNIDKDVVNLINELLKFWSNRDSYGLPVGSNASRILAEAALIEVDKYLISKKISFCRFVDDYRIFAKDAATAHNHLAILTQRLNKEGLFLNTSKTSIRTVKDVDKITNDEKDDKKDITKNNIAPLNQIILGYSGVIPFKFRELSVREKNKLKKEDEIEKLKKLDTELLINPEDFKQTVKIIIAKEEYEKLVDIVYILDKFPQFFPYVVNILSKYQNMISDIGIEKISIEIRKWLEKDNIPEYIIINIIRFFNLNRFKNKEIILNYFRNLKRDSGDYIGRAVLECLEDNVTRGEVIEIMQYYRKADIWEKREIIKLVQNVLHKEEKRPFLKDIIINNSDILEEYVAHTNKKGHPKYI